MKKVKRNRVWPFPLLLAVIMIFTVACTTDTGNNEEEGTDADPIENGEENNEEVVEEPEEVTITISGSSDEEDFNDRFKEPIEAALAHITVEHFDLDDTEQAVLANNLPVLHYYSGVGTAFTWDQEYGLAQDLRPFIEESNFDLSHIQPGLVAIAESITPGEDRLVTLPLNSRLWYMQYNKDVFDAFGVSYPEDGMTYYEVFDLARQITGEREGVHYMGMNPNSPDNWLRQRNDALALDPETMEVTFDSNPVWQRYWAKLENLFSIPGLTIPGNSPREDRRGEPITIADDFMFGRGGQFFADGQVGMVVTYDNYPNIIHQNAVLGNNVDVVTMPVWEDQLTTGANPQNRAMVMNTLAEDHKKEAAWEIMQFLLSPEYQTYRSSEFLEATALMDEDIQLSLGTELPAQMEVGGDIVRNPADYFAELNYEASFQLEPLIYDATEHEFENHVQHTYLRDTEKYNAFAAGEYDINTFLRLLQEEGEQRLAEALGQN